MASRSSDVVLPVIEAGRWAGYEWQIILALELLLGLLAWVVACWGQMQNGKDIDTKDTKYSELQNSDASGRVGGLQMALDFVRKDVDDLRSGGMSRGSFFLGILNVALTSSVLVSLPEHLWLLYLCKCLVLIPLWWKTVARLHNGHLFIIDFCWVANIAFGLYFMLALAGRLSPWQQKSCFLVFFCNSLGPISWANLALGNGISFHSTIELVSNFVHMSPCLVTLAMMAWPTRLAEAWPHRFPSIEILDATPWTEIYIHGAIFYFIWLVIHGIWLLTVGVTAPERGWNTVFDWLNGKGGWGAMWEKKGVQGVRMHAFLYLVTHAVLCQFALVFGALALKFLLLHVIFAVIVVSMGIWVGANKYQYLIMRKTEKKLEAMLASEKENQGSYSHSKPRLSVMGTTVADDE